MKARIFSLFCVGLIAVATAPRAFAGGQTDEPKAKDYRPAQEVKPSGFAIGADTIIGRPACLVATGCGSVLFVLSLPIAAITGSVKNTARELVGKPAHATFVRKLGDFSALEDF